MILHLHRVRGVLRRDKGAQLLADQREKQVGAELAVHTTEPPPAGFASDHDESAVWGEGPAQM